MKFTIITISYFSYKASNLIDLFSNHFYTCLTLREMDKRVRLKKDSRLLNISHSSPRRLAGEKKSSSYNHKTTIWVSHEYYLNPEFHKIPARAF